MKYILIILVFFSFNKIIAQDLDKIKKADTIYIYFKEDRKKQIHHLITTSNKDKNYDEYIFDFSNRQVSFYFSNRTTVNNVRKERKKFLKKNKDLILNYDFIEKIGNLYIAEMIGYIYDAKKIVYVIEDKEIKCSKITLKQVRITGPVRFSEE